MLMHAMHVRSVRRCTCLVAALKYRKATRHLAIEVKEPRETRTTSAFTSVTGPTMRHEALPMTLFARCKTVPIETLANLACRDMFP